MSDRIAVMNEGRILQIDTPVGIYERPATRFVADFVGETNFLTGCVQRVWPGERVQVCLQDQLLDIPCRANGIASGQDVTIAIRPEKLNVQLSSQPVQVCLRAVVEEAIYLGTDTRYLIRLTSGESITARVQNMSNRSAQCHTVGDRVWVSWAAVDSQLLTG